MAAEPRTVRVSDLLGNYEVRRLAARKLGQARPVQRHTLIRWRELHDFPEPIKKLRSGELWDARHVRAWFDGR
jgi:hypothetical protein